MKRILFILALATCTATYAQLSPSKGSWYLGGSAGFSVGSTSQGTVTSKRSSWSASPETGVFLTDQIQLGLGITSAGSYADLPSANSMRSLQFGGTIYSRYLFGTGAFRPFLGISTGYFAGQSKMASSGNKSYINTFNANFNAGFAYYVTPRIGIFGSIGVLGYTNVQNRASGVPTQTSNDFGFNINTMGNRFTIGMYYTICQGKATN